MDISNRALGLLLVAAIVISIGGTVISLNKLDSVSTTGFATNNQNGTVTLNIADVLSIIIQDDAINFGDCTLPSGVGITVDSELAQGGLNNTLCSATGAFPDSLTVENNGNVNANVTITSNVTGTNFLNSATSWIAYKGANHTGNPGCVSGLTDTYTNITTTAKTAFCDNLQFSASGDHSADLYVKSYIDVDATTGGIMQLTFTGHNIA